MEVVTEELTLGDVMNLRGKISLGLCCINTELRDQKAPIFCSRSMIRRTFTVDKAMKLSIQNVNDISKMIVWNSQNGINHLRLSSDMFPHFTDPETESYTLDFAVPYLQQAGECAKCYNHRITMHPGQFVQIGAINENVFEKTVQDLKMHADILDHMNIEERGTICIHGGGVYGDKETTIRRWIDRFDELPRNVKNRLAIEHCEYAYSVRDCLTIAEACKIPLIHDTHHYTCYNIIHPDEHVEPIQDMMGEIIDSWRGSNPVFHISEQSPYGRTGAHSDYVEKIPDYILRVPLDYNVKLSLEVEAKMKEKAIHRLRENYKSIF